MSVNSKMTAIADEIRAKTGGTEPLSLDDMAENVPKVYEAGKKAEYDAFWDALQNYGKRKAYYGAFGIGFTPENFKPKYPIVPKRSYNDDTPESHMFYYTNREGGNNKIDLTDYPIDLSHLYDSYSGGVTTVFDNANVENVFVDLSNVKSVDRLFTYANSDNASPHNIRLRITESLTSISNMVYYWGANSASGDFTLSFTEDSVLVASLGLNQAKFLTSQCIRNIFGVMSDTVSGQTLTLKTDAIIYAFGSVDSEEWQTLVASKPNWTISLV